MSDILLSSEVSVLLFTQLLLLTILSVAIIFTLKILWNYKRGATTALQYKIEKQAYLIIVIIQVVLLIKILLVPFFAYTLNELANILPGAMCGAGVINSNGYGDSALFLQMLIIMSASLWLVLNSEDQKRLDAPYFRVKLIFFIFIYILFLLEVFSEMSFFINLDTTESVQCCSSIYGQDDSSRSLFASMPYLEVMGIFYVAYGVVLLSAFFKKRVALFLSSSAFAYIAYYAIVYAFGLYIYELPTHKCPFCMLQSDYYYVGYFIFTSLFVATFYAFRSALYPFAVFEYKRMVFWYTSFIVLTSLPFVIFMIKNRTFL